MWQDLYQVSDCFVCIDTYADSEKEIRIMIKQIGTLNIEIERRKIKNINIYETPNEMFGNSSTESFDEEVFRLRKKKSDF